MTLICLSGLIVFGVVWATYEYRYFMYKKSKNG